jgi:hypothetical protein
MVPAPVTGVVPVCDVCGKSATQAARDLVRYPDETGTWWQYAPVGRVKYGCDAHPVCSIELER